MEINNDIGKIDTIHETVKASVECTKCKRKKDPEEFQIKKNGDLYRQCNSCIGSSRASKAKAKSNGSNSSTSNENESIPIPEVIYELPLESVQELEEMAGNEKTEMEVLQNMPAEELKRHKEDMYIKALSKNTFKKAGETLGYFLIVGAGMAESGIQYLPTEQILGTKASLNGFQKEIYLMKPEFDQCLSEILLETPSAAQKLASPWTRLGFLMMGAAGNTIKRNSMASENSTEFSKENDSFRNNPNYK